MNWWRAVVLAVGLTVAVAAVEANVPDDEAGHQEPGFQFELVVQPEDQNAASPDRPMGSNAPGQAAPATAVASQAIIIVWDTWRTVVVIGDGVGVQRPAWVATYYRDAAAIKRDPNLLAQAKRRGFDPTRHEAMPLVAYRALAFTDAQGRLHIDARKAVIGGALSGSRSAWIPDSFMVTPPTSVLTMDDEESHPPNTGEVTERIPGGSPRFRELYALILLAVGGGI